MTTLYLVRHGETVDNAAQILQGQRPGQLNDRGIAQAEEVSQQLATTHIDAFVASDLQRAIHTAEIIARPHHKPVNTTPLLRERDWGGFTGMYIPDLKNATWPDDIETLGAMQDRARRFLAWIRKNYPNQTVLAVGHGIINKAIQAVYYKKTMKDIQKMGNAETRVLHL